MSDCFASIKTFHLLTPLPKESFHLLGASYHSVIKNKDNGNNSYRVYIKYCVFSEFLKISRTLVFLSIFSLVVSVCTHTRQVENQRCSRTGRVQTNHKILRKKHNIECTPCMWVDGEWHRVRNEVSLRYAI